MFMIAIRPYSFQNFTRGVDQLSMHYNIPVSLDIFIDITFLDYLETLVSLYINYFH